MLTNLRYVTSGRKKNNVTLVISWCQVFLPCSIWQLVASFGRSAVGCLKQFVLKPTMGLGQNAFPDSCSLFGIHLQ